MIVALKKPKRPATVADLIESLDGVPPSRIKLIPTPGKATIRDLEKPENKCCELIAGTLVEKPMGWEESMLSGLIITKINNLLAESDLGMCTNPDGMYQFFPGRARGPDVAFVPWDRMPGGKPPTDAVPRIVPTLVVEVPSKSNTKKEMERKRHEYFDAGVLLVWEIDPKWRSAKAFTSPRDFTAFGANGKLSAGSVLPGFTLSLKELFARLDARKK